DEAQFFGRGTFGKLLARLWPRPDLEWARHAGLSGWRARVLDVGCGSGRLLAEFARRGFTDLTGVEPFLPGDSQPAPGVRLLARSLDELDERDFDLVMFHHSLEHLPDQIAALRRAALLLRPGGVCLVRTPLASCEARRLYGPDWVEWDAPRHLFVHTPHSLARAAHVCGLEWRHLGYDVDPFPYWGSELYRRGLSLYDPERRALRSARGVFTPDELRVFTARAAAAVRRGRGGPAVVALRRPAARAITSIPLAHSPGRCG